MNDVSGFNLEHTFIGCVRISPNFQNWKGLGQKRKIIY